MPVRLPDKDADGTYESGLDFGDYSRMQTSTHGAARARSVPRPAWVLNTASCRAVILAYLLRRLFSKLQRARITGTDREKFDTCIAALKVQAVAQAKIVDGLCAEYVTCVQPDRRRILEKQISNLDAQIRMAQNPDVFFFVIRDYYLSGFDSPTCATRSGLSPWGVRQLLSRLNESARLLGFEVQQRKPPVRLSAEEKARRDAARDQRREEVAAIRAARKAEHARKVAEVEAARIEREKQQLLEQAVARAAKHSAKVAAARAAAEMPRAPRRVRRVRVEGRCKDCGAARDKQYSCCEKCRKFASAAKVARRVRRANAGLCTACGGVRVDKQKHQCEKCREKMAAHRARQRSVNADDDDANVFLLLWQ